MGKSKMTKHENDNKVLVLEELNALIDKRKLELSNFEDRINEAREILTSLDEVKNTFEKENEKFEELKADVRSNIRNDKEVIFRDVLQPKMEERYRNFVLDRAADRYSKLTQIELMTFVQRNAFQIMRQNAI